MLRREDITDEELAMIELERRTATADELGELFDCTPRHVRELVRQGHLPRPLEHGKYRLVESIRCFLMYTLLRRAGIER